jgi:hypothetical protein
MTGMHVMSGFREGVSAPCASTGLLPPNLVLSFGIDTKVTVLLLPVPSF